MLNQPIIAFRPFNVRTAMARSPYRTDDNRTMISSGSHRRKRKGRFGCPLNLIVLTIVCCGLACGPATAAADSEKEAQVARGPLRVLHSNPRYFTDGTGKAIYMTGSHIWNNFQDWSNEASLDYEGFLDFLQSHNHNFTRMWTWEHASDPGLPVPWPDDPLPYLRTRPGNDVMGRPQFELTKLNQAYFDRLRSRVKSAQDRNMYVSVMLFQGWSVESKGEPIQNPWQGHPLNINNNVNGINGDVDGDGEGTEVHTLQVPAITALQEAYVKKTIDTLNDLDNVLYEISNESHANSVNWQYHMITFIKSYEAGKPKQHPVGMTTEYPGADYSELTNSPADWISPHASQRQSAHGQNYDYRSSPPAADGRKVIISDTDHLWGLGGNPDWVWKSFLRGLNPIFMDLDPKHDLDPYHMGGGEYRASLPNWESIRSAMGYTREFAERIDLASMTPHTEIASSGYCMASEGEEYLVYLPADDDRSVEKTVSVDLSAASAAVTVEWFNPRTAETILAGTTRGGTIKEFTAPFPGEAVLYIRAHK